MASHKPVPFEPHTAWLNGIRDESSSWLIATQSARLFEHRGAAGLVTAGMLAHPGALLPGSARA